ncbi:MAG: hypothetical protein AAF234_15890 [Pseudomonadota bacterium]
MNEAPHMAPGPTVPGPPPPNGFTRIVRRLMSATSGLTFFALVIADALALVREIPFQLYALLAVMAIFATQAGNNLLDKIMGSRR